MACIVFAPAEFEFSAVRDYRVTVRAEKLEEVFRSVDWAFASEPDHARESSITALLSSLFGGSGPPRESVQTWRVQTGVEGYCAEWKLPSPLLYWRAEGPAFSAVLSLRDGTRSASISGRRERAGSLPAEVEDVFALTGWNPSPRRSSEEQSRVAAWDAMAASSETGHIEVAHPFVDELRGAGSEHASGGVRLRGARCALPVMAWFDILPTGTGTSAVRMRTYIDYFDAQLPYPRRMLRLYAVGQSPDARTFEVAASAYEAKWIGSLAGNPSPKILLPADVLVCDTTAAAARRYFGRQTDRWSALARSAFCLLDVESDPPSSFR